MYLNTRTKIKQNLLSFNNPEDIHDIPIIYNDLYIILRHSFIVLTYQTNLNNSRTKWDIEKISYKPLYFNLQEILEMKKTYYENHRTGGWARISMSLPHPFS